MCNCPNLTKKKDIICLGKKGLYCDHGQMGDFNNELKPLHYTGLGVDSNRLCSEFIKTGTLTVTSLVRSPHHYGHLTSKVTSLVRSPH